MRIGFLSIILVSCSMAWGKELKVEEYLNLMKKKDVEIRRFIHQQVQTRFNEDLNLPNSTWLFSLTNSHGLATGNASTTRRTEASLNKNFRDTGTEISLSYNTNNLADRAEKVQSAQIEQSLLQNFFGLQTRQMNESLIEQNKVILWQVVESYEDYIATKINQYLDFVLAYENYKTAQDIYKESYQLWKEIQERKRKNIALNVDIYRSHVELIQYERMKLESQIEMQRARDTLLSTFDDEQRVAKNILPSRQVPFANEQIDFMSTNQSFLKESRTVKISEAQSKSADLDLSANKKDNLPEAKLILGYNNDESRRFNTLINREEKVIGFNFTYQLDSSLNDAQIAQARYNKTQVELNNISTKRQAEAQIKSLQNQITLQKQRVELLEKQVGIYKKLIKGERSRYRRGRVSLKIITDAQTAYTQNRYELTRQKVALAKFIVNWKQVTDTLVDSIAQP